MNWRALSKKRRRKATRELNPYLQMIALSVSMFEHRDGRPRVISSYAQKFALMAMVATLFTTQAQAHCWEEYECTEDYVCEEVCDTEMMCGWEWDNTFGWVYECRVEYICEEECGWVEECGYVQYCDDPPDPPDPPDPEELVGYKVCECTMMGWTTVGPGLRLVGVCWSICEIFCDGEYAGDEYWDEHICDDGEYYNGWTETGSTLTYPVTVGDGLCP